MAIISIEEQWTEMTVSETASNGYSGTRKFIVVCDTPNESPSAILADTRLPQLGSLFPGSNVVYLTERTPSRIGESREVWYVNLSYTSILSQEQRDRVQHKDPLQRAASIEWISEQRMRTYRRILASKTYYTNYTPLAPSDFEMQAAANSATDPYEPVLEQQEDTWTAVIKKNVDKIPVWFLTYANSVNNADLTLNFYGSPLVIPKGCAKLGKISMPRAKQENGVEYVQLSFAIATRPFRERRAAESAAPEPWDEEILDQGMRTYEDADDGTTAKAWKNVDDINGNGVTLPVPFNGAGGPIGTPGDGRIEERDLKWRLWRPCVRKDFSVLPIT